MLGIRHEASSPEPPEDGAARSAAARHSGPPSGRPGTSESAGAVVVRSVSKTFGNDVQALEDVSFEAGPGEFVSVIGPSGCGKSTLLRLAAGLLPLTQGDVRINGSSVTEPRLDVAMMFQQPVLLPWKTALENVLLPRELQRRSGDSAHDDARELLELVGLDEFAHAYPTQLSGGMQQRVALARSLMVGAGILLLDEPFGSVDELTREKLNLELLKIHEALSPTVVLITHNISEAVFLADRVLVMTPRPGRIAEVLDVPLDRPRSIDMTGEATFGDLTFRARKMLTGFEEEAA